jgi:general stress protein 26
MGHKVATAAEPGQAVQKLAELIADIKFAMLTTRADDGTLRSRPMTTQQVEFDGTLWFLTGQATDKTSEIAHDQQVNLSYVDADDNRFVSVAGRARIFDDRAKARDLWSPAYKAWFPKGLDDPDLRVLRVDVSGAEYWDAPSSTVVQLVGFAKAIATGQRYEGGGDNETVRF